ncbi:hypothetical protein [Candidatus Mycolicibacterium alkanivorans]|uniref:Serine/threonine protein kinase n=1 Tax=Candidatus Mycolicibacterium alkanivorans TaxID=2954114 RepID=A0ABS9YU14_9MYCO|nr:hypothetical protein [Candidatus Mycolicibacterium alkanivorans]MCI4674725.1 hypothetical protein [Candidatus Mycolicibacterium alkanivorans]
MTSRLWIRTGQVATVAAGSALLAFGLPSAAAAPAFDSQGYVDSTARCAGTAVLFGSTDTSRVAICPSSSGGYEYRGVRVRDGAKLILTATPSGSGSFVAENDGITYTVNSRALTVSSGRNTIRSESWVDFHGSQAPKSPGGSTVTTTTTTTTTTTSGTAAPSTSSAPTSTTPTSTTPLPPPLPAEVGGSSR